MNPIKINISAEVREFNEAVELADSLLDYGFDRLNADALLIVLEDRDCYPVSVEYLKKAISGLAIKRVDPLAACKAIVKLLDGSQPKDIPGALMVAQSAIKR